MAKKEISPWEQHVEKIILGVGVLVAIWFFYTQVVAPKPLEVLPKDVVDVRVALEDVVSAEKRPVPELQLPQIHEKVRTENKPGHIFPADQPVEYNPLVPWAPLYPADRSKEVWSLLSACGPAQGTGKRKLEQIHENRQLE